PGAVDVPEGDVVEAVEGRRGDAARAADLDGVFTLRLLTGAVDERVSQQHRRHAPRADTAHAVEGVGHRGRVVEVADAGLLVAVGGVDVYRLVERHAVEGDAADLDRLLALRQRADEVQPGAAGEARVHGQTTGVIVVAGDDHHGHLVLAHDAVDGGLPQLERADVRHLRVEDVSGHDHGV